MDIIEYFLKSAYSYLLTNKSVKKVLSKILSKIKLFILNFGKCNKFQTDNWTEFKNKELRLYIENKNIKQIFSRVYHSQSNGAVEALHQSARKYLLNELIPN